MNEGRRPLAASPYSVNWETTSTAPPTSARARIILPSASLKSRSPATFSAIQSTWAGVSPCVKPARSRKPAPISPATRSSMVTLARVTRWRTTRTSLHGDGLGEIARLVHVAPPAHRHVIGEQLERDDGEDRRQEVERLRNGEGRIREPLDLGVAFIGDGEDLAAPRLHLLDVRHDLRV